MLAYFELGGSYSLIDFIQPFFMVFFMVLLLFIVFLLPLAQLFLNIQLIHHFVLSFILTQLPQLELMIRDHYFNSFLKP
jgi:hypothetical protein